MHQRVADNSLADPGADEKEDYIMQQSGFVSDKPWGISDIVQPKNDLQLILSLT